MTQITKVMKTSATVDLSKYVNHETGEFLTESIPDNVKLKCKEETGTFVITSDDYAVIEIPALLSLMQILNNSDIGNIIKMSITTKTPLNIVFNNNNIPHTNDSLQDYLQIASKSMFLKLIKRLIKAGVLYQIKGRIYGEVRVCYMLNPFLSRKRKQFEQKVLDVFNDFKLDKSFNK